MGHRRTTYRRTRRRRLIGAIRRRIELPLLRGQLSGIWGNNLRRSRNIRPIVVLLLLLHSSGTLILKDLLLTRGYNYISRGIKTLST